MYGDLKNQLKAELYEIRAAGLYKGERVIDTPEAARVRYAAATTPATTPVLAVSSVLRRTSTFTSPPAGSR